MNRLFDSDPATGEHERADAPLEGAPLAARMRPRTLAEIVGQEHLLAPGSALRAAIESGHPHSAVFIGPPGTGKTTLARLIASASGDAFEEHSAVNAGKAEVRAVIDRARERRRAGRGTIFFLDELHRFNKAQQDALLPAVEEGLIALIGATTENPYFEVNAALLSRCEVYELHPLGQADLEGLLRRALAQDSGLSGAPPADDAAIALLARRADGDARVALSALERAVELTRSSAGKRIDEDTADQALQRGAVRFDRDADQHYDYASALIKAMRGSDPDAAVYYLAVALEGGEDPRFVARRMVIFASEDIGAADPHALPLATAAAQATDRVGMPECRINLAHAAVYLALAPKSNAAYRAIDAATAHIREHGVAPPPPYLRDAHSSSSIASGRGEGYRYPHEAEGAVTDQRLLPAELADALFYEPTGSGAERALAERLRELRRLRDA